MTKDNYISIVFPNWNREAATLRFLESVIVSHYPKNKLEVIMVDNGSTDNSIEKVRKEYPQVKIIKLDKNYGTAYARNRGLEVAKGEYIFCCDNDTVLATDSLKLLYEKLLNDNSIGLIGAKVVSIEDKKTVIAYGYKFNRWLGIENGLSQLDHQKQLDWIPGCCMMFRRSIIKKVGFFDESFTFFGEDADFGLRVKKTGYKIISLPDVIIYHPKKETIELTKEKYLNYYKAKFRLINKHCSFLQKISAISMHMIIYSLVRFLTGKTENWMWKLNALRIAIN